MVIRFMIILFNNSYFVQKLNNNIIGLENTFLNQVNNIMELKKKWLFGQINTKLCKNYLSIYRHSAIGLSAFFICFLYLHSSQKKLRGDALFVKNADTKIMQIVPLLIQTTISWGRRYNELRTKIFYKENENVKMGRTVNFF